MRTMAPSTSPPPSTLSSSAIPRGFRFSVPPEMVSSGWGAAAPCRDDALRDLGASRSSAKLFQALQSGHLPSPLGLTYPHDWHWKLVFNLDIGKPHPFSEAHGPAQRGPHEVFRLSDGPAEAAAPGEKGGDGSGEGASGPVELSAYPPAREADEPGPVVQDIGCFLVRGLWPMGQRVPPRYDNRFGPCLHEFPRCPLKVLARGYGDA